MTMMVRSRGGDMAEEDAGEAETAAMERFDAHFGGTNRHTDKLEIGIGQGGGTGESIRDRLTLTH